MTRFKLFGAAAEYFASEDREVLCESGARTGKTHSVLVKTKYILERYPGARYLFARETRKSLTETVLPDWENKVLGRGHPAIGKQKRNHRDAYHFPNGSTVVLHGLDDPENILSGEFDGFAIFQAEQLKRQDTYDALLSRLSGSATPYRQATLDVNPAGARHWIILRAKETLCLACASVVEPSTAKICQACGSTAIGRMRHLEYRHSDNPLLFDHLRCRDCGNDTGNLPGHPCATCGSSALGLYNRFGWDYLTQTLGRLRGVRRKRLLEHKWVSEEGQILEDYDSAVHRVSGKLKKDPVEGWILTLSGPGWSKGSSDPMRESKVPISWFGAGADWGFEPDPGCMQVWAYDHYGRRFMVAQVYRLRKQMEWWAQIAVNLWREFDMQYIAVDPSAKAMWELFNEKLTSIGGPAIAMGADNVIRRQNPDLAGIDLMRWGLRDPQGIIRTFFVKDNLREGVDPDLREAGRPTCLEDEIEEWVFARNKTTGAILEKPEPGNDHGLDTWRYEQGEGWGNRGAATQKRDIIYPEGSKGDIHNTAEKMRKARQWSIDHGY